MGITGVMLFFDMAQNVIKDAHGWLGLIFVLAACAHAYRHWSNVGRYIRTRLLWTNAALVLVLAATIIIPTLFMQGSGDRENLLRIVTSAPLEKVAPVLGSSPEELAAKLKAQGISLNSHQESLRQLAQRTGREMPELLHILMAK
jgi:hypothetical protein